MEFGFNYSELKELSVFEILSLLNSLFRKRELDNANTWYSQKESTIYSEAREREKKADGSLCDEPSEAVINHKEEILRQRYYRETLEEIEQADPDEDMINYYKSLEVIHDKIKRSNN